MLTNIFPPKNSLKNIIFNILLNEKDLTVEKIKKILKNNYQKSVTYQGINKILNFLKYENVIIKSKKIWEVNQEWLNNIISTLSLFNEELKQNNFNKKITSITFQNTGKAWEFFIKKIKKGSFNLSKEKPIILHVKNFGYFSRNKEELEFLKKFAKEYECIFIVERKNVINNYIAKYLRSIGIKVYMEIPHSTPHSTIIIGDVTILMYYTGEDLVDYHTKVHNKIKNLTSLKAIKMFTNIREDNRFKIHVVFNYDSEIANLTRKHILKFVKKYKK